MDIVPTILAAVDAAEPWHPLDGVDLSPFVRGSEEGPPHDALFWRRWADPPNLPHLAVKRADGWKLYKHRKQFAELYHIPSDPGEEVNFLANGWECDPRARSLATALLDDWNEWHAGTQPNQTTHGQYWAAVEDRGSLSAQPWLVWTRLRDIDPHQLAAEDALPECRSG